MIDIAITVLYEDNHIIAVNKPAGLLSQPTELEHDSLELRIKAWIKEKYQKPGNVFLGVVHRLDRPVSGIVIFAKTSKALSRLNETIRSQNMQKTYCAFVEGNLKKKQETLEHFLRHDDHFSDVSNKNDREAKPARLQYKTLKDSENAALLEITLETGRYHQIRCQCAVIGHPIIGDLKYGAKKGQKILPKLPPGVIALHHMKLTLIHPITKDLLDIEAPLPPYFL